MITLTEFRPGLWLTELALADFDVRGAVIIGQQRAVVWDTLSRPSDMTPVQALIGNQALSIVYSHADWDHVWGTAGQLTQVSRLLGKRSAWRAFPRTCPSRCKRSR